MRYLLDTQLILLIAMKAAAVPTEVASIVSLEDDVFFSAASLWEIAIKFGRGKPDFVVNPYPLRKGLLQNGFIELPITSEQVMYVASLPHLHKDPFDRLLIAQAIIEGITLLTTDRFISQYPGPIQLV